MIISSELILVVTILVIGLIAGLATLRDAVTQELGDTGAAIGFIKQDYSFPGTANQNAAATTGSAFDDMDDTGDTADANAGNSGNGVDVTIGAVAGIEP